MAQVPSKVPRGAQPSRDPARDSVRRSPASQIGGSRVVGSIGLHIG